MVTSNLKVELEGRGPLTLRPTDYVATGGEGTVYRANATVVKVYTDKKKMARDGMAEKVRLLRALKHPYIVAPEGLVFDSSRQPIGYYMPFADGEPLPRILTNAAWQRLPFDPSKANILVERMRETVGFVHDHQALMVDANEFNWIVGNPGKDPEPRAIDVDSWTIGRHKSSVLMPSIRDWHSPQLSSLTDWFAWGIVTFQVFSGIHPYKGTLTGFDRNDLAARMKANASVFRPGVGLNRAVRDFRTIPGPLLDWYLATFEQGMRSEPPSVTAKGIAQVARAARTLRTVTKATGSLEFEKIFEQVGDPVQRMFFCGAVMTKGGSVFDLALKRKIGSLDSPDGEVVRVPGGWLLADTKLGVQSYTFVDDRSYAGTPLSCGLRGRTLLRYENRLFLVTDDALVELVVMNVGKPLLTLGTRTSILLPQATTWFDGLGIEEAMGAVFMVLPFGEKACVTVRVKELDALKPVTARAGNRFATVIGLARSGTYRKLEFTFSADYSSYQVFETDVDSPELNIAILPKGVCATIVEDGKLVIFVPVNGQVKRVDDQQIATDMTLANWGDVVAYEQGGAVWKLRLK